MNAFRDYFRCPEELAVIGTRAGLSPAKGYFKFRDAIAFGRLAGAKPSKRPTDALVDVTDVGSIRDGRPILPFDLSEVSRDLRQERYRQNGDNWLQHSATGQLARRLYYAVRPLLGVGLRKHLQRTHLGKWKRIAFPRWPVDLTVETLMEGAMTLAIKARRGAPVPFIWFWPDGASSCAMMTHDIEGQAGIDFTGELMDIDDVHGIKSAFQIIPEDREELWLQTAERLRARGFEANLHDLNHDGRLFAERSEFLARAKRLNRYASDFGCDGFRSGAMYREQDWYGAFHFAYDMSVPNAAHLEPQRGGCCTVMPYFVGDVLELPLTTTQDYTLFHILNDYSIRLWREQIALITERHGLVSVISHPDYLAGPRERAVYVDLLKHLSALRDREGLWIALPGEINRWWRNRRAMSLVPVAGGWRIDGPDSERACLAYASLDGDRIVYTLQERRARAHG